LDHINHKAKMPVQSESVIRNFEMLRKNSFSRLTGELRRVQDYVDDNEKSPISIDCRRKLAGMMNKYTPGDRATIQNSLVRHIEYSLAKNRWNCDEEAMYRAAALSIRDRLVEVFNDTNASFFKVDPKRIYYLSFEFLIGRAMQNALINLGIEGAYKDALKDVGFNLEELYEHEHDAALGNGGLGRLAACFLDSAASLNIPVWGYGIRYTYGIFEQKIVNGRQIEHPDYWLVNSNPWEIERPDVNYKIRLGGEVSEYTDKNGIQRFSWTGGNLVQAEAYDNPIPGYDTSNCISIRLWRSRPTVEFDFHKFDQGDYLNAVAERQAADAISAVLYPNDNNEAGKELRLKQQYFFVSATIQDVLRRFMKVPGRSWSELPQKIVMQLNDTHPTIAIPELMRILIDVQEFDFHKAWDLTRQVFCYTNHTVLPEALEKWDADLIGRLLPRHLLIINDINYHFLMEASKVFPNQGDVLSRLSIYEEGDSKKIRMANLAVIGSNKVNGVAAMHSELVKTQLFPEFVEFFKKSNPDQDKFVNVTNGVTIRRWLHNANRRLSNLITDTIGGDEWLKNYTMMESLIDHAKDTEFQNKWREVKLFCKKRLCNWVKCHTGVTVSTDMMIDCLTKRIHEYKRQHMFAFWMIRNYLNIKSMNENERKNVTPRCCMVSGKAAPGYRRAKVIIKMINNIANLVNNDAEVSPYFKVAFLPNYNVSSAAVIIPGCDVSEQISTAGMEASGTGNMKYVMNGALIIGTMDGANVEIREEIGEKNIFIFGLMEEETHKARQDQKDGNYPVPASLMEVFDFIRNGAISNGEKDAHEDFISIVNDLCSSGNGFVGDHYLVIKDFESYCKAQDTVSVAYKDQNKWTEMTIRSCFQMGKFSSDRSIVDYSEQIWNCNPVDVMAVTSKYENVEKKFGYITPKAQEKPKKVVVSNENVPEAKVPSTVTANKNKAKATDAVVTDKKLSVVPDTSKSVSSEIKKGDVATDSGTTSLLSSVSKSMFGSTATK